MFENNSSNKNIIILILVVGLLVTAFSVFVNFFDFSSEETLPAEEEVVDTDKRGDLESMFFSSIENENCYDAWEALNESEIRGWQIERGNELGRCFFEIGQLDVSKEVFLDDLERRDYLKSSTKAEIHLWLANVYLDREDFENSKKHLDKAKELDETRSDLFFVKGLFFYEKGEFEKSEQNLEKCLELIKDTANLTGGLIDFEEVLTSKVFLGWSLFHQGKYEDSKSVFKKALKYKEDEEVSGEEEVRYLLFAGLGWYYFMNEDFEKANKYYDELELDYYKLEPDPSFIYIYRGKGWAHLNLGEYEEAKKYFEVVFKIAENVGFSPSSLIYAGLIASEQNLGNTERANDLKDEAESLYDCEYLETKKFP